MCPVLISKPENKEPLGRPRYRWRDNKLDIKEIAYQSLDKINLTMDRE
jgi:hypothetical protein